MKYLLLTGLGSLALIAAGLKLQPWIDTSHEIESWLGRKFFA